MRLITATLATLLAISPVLAEEQKPSPPMDQNQTITLTIGELQTLLQTARLQVQAAIIADKINTQVKPKQPTK